LSKIAAKPLKFWGLAVAAAGGEMRSNYFQNSALIPSFYVTISAKFNKVAVWELQKN
jgi:hypothetical protein